MNMLWLLGGLGMGGGLMYLLNPEQGEGRRDAARGHVAAYGRQPDTLLDDTTWMLGRQAQASSPRPASRLDVSRGSGNDCARRPSSLGYPQVS